MYFDLDTSVKTAQIIFYGGGLLVAVLTYIRARSTILNTVNTEYHKKVIERVATMSEELYREFDFSSDEAWHKCDDVEEVVKQINEGLIKHKEAVLARSEFWGAVPASPKLLHLLNLSKKYKSDPFLPAPIRDKLVALLKKRSDEMLNAYMEVLWTYQSELAQGKHWDTLDTNHKWLHNQINDRLRTAGVGISQVEDAVHDVRLEIQRYFQKFNPVE
jgi:hypothetical protein